ncbi:MAG TPA: DUF308 domain-containing protein [Bacteroidales bacterium]|nr:DUF308 domain-containing protein [Bacteroidales bacterium]
MKNDWQFKVIKGVLFILFGLLALFYPGATLVTLVKWFGIIILIGGILLLIGSGIFKGIKQIHNFVLAEGILDILIGIAIIAYPRFVAGAVVVLFGIWALVSGILQLVSLNRLPAAFSGRGMILVNGIISVLLGLLMLFNPFGSGKALLVVLGVYALFHGFSTIYAAIKTSQNS